MVIDMESFWAEDEYDEEQYNIDNNPYYKAVFESDYPGLRYLLDRKEDYHKLDWYDERQAWGGETCPLQKAVEMQDTTSVKILLENVDSVHLENWFACLTSAVVVAARLGNSEIVTLLVHHGASSEYALIEASRYDHMNIVVFLVEIGVNVNTSDEDGITPLMLASMKGNLEMVKLLISAGADPNQTDNDKTEIALYEAAYHGHEDIFYFLMPLTSPVWYEIAYETLQRRRS